MADTSLDILIQTKAELQGAIEAAESLERTIGKAKALGKEYAALEAQLGRARAAINAATPVIQAQEAAQKKLTDSTKKKLEAAWLDHDLMGKTREELGQNVAASSTLEEATTKLSISKREMHKILRLLPGPVRELGQAFYALAKNPIVAFLMAAVVAIKLLLDHFKKLNEKLSTVPGKSLNKGLEEVAATAKLAADKTFEYENAINKSATATEKLQDSTDKLIGKLKEQLEAANEVAESEKEIAIAKIEALHDTGQISDGEYARRIAKVDETAASGKIKRQQEARQKEIAILQDQKKQADDALGFDFVRDQKKNELQRGANNAKIDYDSNESKIKTLDDLIKGYETKLKETGKLTHADSAAYAHATVVKADLEGARKDLGIAQKRAEKALNDFITETESLQTKSRELTKTIEEKTRQNELQTKTEETVLKNTTKASTIKRETVEAIHNEGAVKEILEKGKAALKEKSKLKPEKLITPSEQYAIKDKSQQEAREILAKGRFLPKEKQQDLDRLAELLRALGWNDKTSMAAMQSLITLHKDNAQLTQKQVAILKSQIDTLRLQLKTTRNQQ